MLPFYFTLILTFSILVRCTHQLPSNNADRDGSFNTELTPSEMLDIYAQGVKYPLSKYSCAYDPAVSHVENISPIANKPVHFINSTHIFRPSLHSTSHSRLIRDQQSIIHTIVIGRQNKLAIGVNTSQTPVRTSHQRASSEFDARIQSFIPNIFLSLCRFQWWGGGAFRCGGTACPTFIGPIDDTRLFHLGYAGIILLSGMVISAVI
ncbi:hypothetical protein BJ138DRAFT_271805 [Hygrophoropsis aurantiaca]|uniref:Uncharacterized protein n=1 Tax=Hygrophoropsis aurantiaca TaxID=72124 RepID=A0ACB8A7X9_9AGAM|nr:hypothetical protein BJ138DRAFT_271805 [Hygrophoropsis aurantiaca]